MGHVSGVRDHVQPQLFSPVKRGRAGDTGVLLRNTPDRGHSPEHTQQTGGCRWTHLDSGTVSELVDQQVLLPEVSLPTLQAAEGPFSRVTSDISR